jgi:hypothetical protein
VHDDVEAIRPVGILVQRDPGIRCCSSLMYHSPMNIRTSTDAASQNQLLPIVIMATPASTGSA